MARKEKATGFPTPPVADVQILNPSATPFYAISGGFKPRKS